MIEGLDTDILKEFKRGVPIYTRQPVPTFRTAYERDKYYDQKKQVWTEGKDGLTGMHIYYLDEIYLFNRVTGETFYPICRDIDVMLFHKIDQLRKRKKWMYVTKGRGVGLSTIMFSLPHYFFRVYPGSKCVATTGKDKKTLSHLFSNYFMHGYNHLDELIKPKFVNKNETSAESYLRMQIKIKEADGQTGLRNSEFICRETSDTPKSPTAFSGYGAIYGGFDEIPLHPRWADLIKSAREIFIDPITKEMVGFCLGGGTIEDSITPEQIVDLQKFIQTCDALNFEHSFIPATWGNEMTNGWSDIAKAEKKIRARRQELDQLSDKAFLKAEIKNNPLTLEEIFDMGGSGMFEEDVLNIVRETLKAVVKQEASTGPYGKPHILTNLGGNVVASPAKNSPVILLEHPKPGVSYKAGNDGTSTTKDAGIVEGSDVALIITKMYDPQDEAGSFTPIAYYAERPKSFDDSYIKQADLLRYFNKHGLLKVRLQVNQANEHFGAYLHKQQLGAVIGNHHDLGGVAKENKNKMGTYVTDSVIEWYYRQANRVLRKYGHNFKCKRLLEEILLPYKVNTDLLDAWLMGLIEMGIDFDKPASAAPQQFRERIDNILQANGTFKRVRTQVAI